MEHLEFQGANLHPALLLSLHQVDQGKILLQAKCKHLHIMMQKPLEQQWTVFGQRDSSLLTLKSAFPQKKVIYAF